MASTTASWNTVVEILTQQVVSLMAHPDRGQEWIAHLPELTLGEQAGICIAIDVVAGALDPSVFARILDSFPQGETGDIQTFARAIDAHPESEKFSCKTLFGEVPLQPGERYVKVLEFGAFVSRYLKRTFPHLGVDAASIKEARYIVDHPSFRFSAIDAWWSGFRNRVWVTSSNVIEAVLHNHQPGEVASEVMDRLGLMYKSGVGEENRPLMFAVFYPSDFGERCVQPTSLDAGWYRSNFYLSIRRMDGWGKTHPCSGLGTSLSERVHEPFGPLGDGFERRWLGDATVRAPNFALLLEQGYRRLAEALAARDLGAAT